MILFVLLCGFPPYEATYGPGDALDARGTLRLVEAQCVRGAWDSFPSPHWDAVSRGAAGPPPPPSRTKWTRRVPHPVLIGHAASLTPY